MTNKIPVKIIQIQDIHGTKNTGVMIDFNYYFESLYNSNKKVEEFKELYDNVVEEIKYLFYEKNNQKSIGIYLVHCIMTLQLLYSNLIKESNMNLLLQIMMKHLSRFWFK